MEYDQEGEEPRDVRPDTDVQLGGLCVITIEADTYSCEQYDDVVRRVLQRQSERSVSKRKSQSTNPLYMGGNSGQVSSALYTESVYDVERRLAALSRRETETVQKVSAFHHAAKVIENLIELGWEPDEGRIRRLCEVIRREHESDVTEEVDRDEDGECEDF